MTALADEALVVVLARMDIEELGGSTAVSTLLDLASDVVRDHIGQSLNEQTSTVVAVGVRGTKFLPPQRPIVSVDTVSIDGVNVTDFNFTNTHLLRDLGWGMSGSTVSITYTHGFDVIPSAAKIITAQLVVRALTQTDNAKQETSGAASITLENTSGLSLDPAMESKLDRFAADRLGIDGPDAPHTISIRL